ncbi:ABC transporter substrate-binding protein [Nesterenkonia halobia]|uniref:ABC transporter substrate-binding protein n=1 Tax=Nesterenkonia halobia TaxID=37922 RepID=A0ABP6REK2_9MICC
MRPRTSMMSLSAVAAASALLLTACDDGGSGGDDGGDGGYAIGISQFVTHPSLDESRDGFKAAFDEAGVDVDWDEQNAQGEQATASTIAGTFATDDLDLVHAIATPSAQAAAQSIQDTPVIFSAVTDPEGAGLVDSWEEPGANVTGASDMNPVDAQFDVLSSLAPDAEEVGVIYSSGETNSEVQVEQAKEAAEELDLEIQEAAVTNSSEVQQGVESFSDVDAIYVPTDNQVVSALESVLQYGQQNSIPVVAAEGDSVEAGAVATEGLDYHQLGRQAGEMALRILEDGEDPASMPVETQENYEVVVNPEAAEAMGVEIPQELMDRADVVVGEDVEPKDPSEAGEDG